MGGVLVLVLFIVFFVLTVISFAKRGYKTAQYEERPWLVMFYIFLGLTVLFGAIFASMFFKIIDAGEIGVQVLFGRMKDHVLTEGFNIKSPFVRVYTYSIRLQEFTMSSAGG